MLRWLRSVGGWAALLVLPLGCTAVKEHYPPGMGPPDPGAGGAGGAAPSTPPPGPAPATPPTVGGPGPAPAPPTGNPPGTGGGSGAAPGTPGNPPPAGTPPLPPAGTGGAGGAMVGTPPGPGGPGPGTPPVPMPPPPGLDPAGQMVEIGGQMVPGDKVLVFIHIGQSNMAGRAQEPAALFDHFIWYGHQTPDGRPDPRFDPNPLPFDPKIWMFNLEGKFVPAREPTASDQSDEAGAGPGMGLMRAARAEWPDHHIISVGRGQSGQRGGYCAHFLERNPGNNQPWSTVPPVRQNEVEGEKRYGYYDEVINRRALKLKGKVIFGGIVAMFGSTEDRPGAPVPSPPAEPFLSQCLIKLAQTYREVLGDPNIPFIITDFEHGAGEYSYNGALGQKVRRQVRLAQSMIPRSEIILTDAIQMRDDHHYTMQGHKTWGETAVQLITKNGWDTWARP
jgi:hypothetical protein